MARGIRISVLLLLLAVAAAMFYVKRPGENPLRVLTNAAADVWNRRIPADVHTEIQRFVEDIELEPGENTLEHAIHLDHNVGRKLVNEGRFREAYDVYRKVLAISANHSSLRGISIALTQLSWVLERKGDIEEAIRVQMLSYKIARKENIPTEYGVTELHIGRLMEHKARDLAMAWRLRARENLRGTRYKRDHASLLIDLARDLQRIGRKAEARAMFRQAWELARGLGNHPDAKAVKWDAALYYIRAERAAGNCEAVDDSIRKVLTTFKKGERETSYHSYLVWELAICASRSGRREEADELFATAYSIYELQRTKSLGDAARARIDKKNNNVINRYVSHLIDAGDQYGALAFLETNKARTLSDILVDDEQQEVYGRWAELERRQAQERAEIYLTRSSGTRHTSTRRYRRLLDAQAEERIAAARSRDIRSVAVSTVLTADELRKIQAHLPHNVAIVSIYVKRSEVSAWVMTRTNLEHVPTKVGWGDYRRAVKELRLSLTNPFQDFYLEPARRLYDEFFAPIEAKLGPEITLIAYSPDELFARIPLTVLHDGKQFLAERYAVHRLPSLRFLAPDKHLGQYRPSRGIGCVDPDIEDARLPRQADTGAFLRDLWGDSFTLLSGSTCSPRMLESAIEIDDKPAFLHIGAHGKFYDPDPMNSGIALSPDRSRARSAFWNARAMGAVDMSNLRLVTLSSCETGIADPKTPRDVFGIQRALFFGGVENMIAPLWAVYDRPTAQLMRSFYTELRRGGRLAESLRAAQLDLIRGGDLSHPHFWSGFILSGGPT